MEVKLSPELERKVRDQVGGPYASPSDVIEQALRSFFGPETLTEAEREDLNRSIDAGLEALARGDVINGDDARNAAIARLRSRHSA